MVTQVAEAVSKAIDAGLKKVKEELLQNLHLDISGELVK